MDETQVTPDQLPAAAARIDDAVRDGAVRNPPVPIGGAGYGHDGAADAVAAFGREIQQRTALMVAEADRAAAALRGGSAAYLAQELRNTARLIGFPAP